MVADRATPLSDDISALPLTILSRSLEALMKFRPLHDRVVVRRIEGEEKTKGGIIIPDTAKEKPQEGEVVAVGPGARDEAGRINAPDVKSRRPHPVRQVVRHRGQDRRSGPPDHEGIRHPGRRRLRRTPPPISRPGPLRLPIRGALGL